MFFYLKNWQRCEKGVTAVEYALITGALCLGIIAALLLVGDGIEGVLNTLGQYLRDNT